MQAPTFLSPSSIATYRECPQKFKLSRIDKIPQPPTWATHLGTFVHEVLEHLYQLDPAGRTRDALKALASERWAVNEWEAKVNALVESQGSIKDFKIQAFSCMTNLWQLEDPQQTELDGMEHEVVAEVEGVALKGFIDRFVLTDEGIVISDYKTGKIPNPQFKSDADKFFQLLAYAAMLEAADQEMTSKVQLLYLGVPVTHELAVTQTSLSIAKGTIVETREGIDAAVSAGAFPCNVTKLCDWCHYKKTGDCPAFGNG